MKTISIILEPIGVSKTFKRVLHINFPCESNTINAASYWMRKSLHISRKGMNFWIRNVILFHNNACLHTFNLTCEKLEECHWTTLEYPPGLTSCDYRMFGPLKEALRNEWFDGMLLLRHSSSVSQKHKLALFMKMALKNFQYTVKNV